MYYLAGKVLSKKDPVIVLDLNGIGYYLTATKSAQAISMVGQTAKLFVVQVLYRSPEPSYFAFGNPTERELFSLLINEAILPPHEAFELVSRAGSALYTSILNKDWKEVGVWLQSNSLNAAHVIGNLLHRLKNVSEEQIQTPDGDIVDADGESLIVQAVKAVVVMRDGLKEDLAKKYVLEAAKLLNANGETPVNDIILKANQLAKDGGN
jgi:Holliday junction resolvasome RuvABC DNA-binding subunit